MGGRVTTGIRNEAGYLLPDVRVTCMSLVAFPTARDSCTSMHDSF